MHKLRNINDADKTALCSTCGPTNFVGGVSKHGKNHGRECVQKNRDRSNFKAAKNREFIRDSKTLPCADCGVSYPPCVMDFDHRDPTEKNFSIGAGSSRSIESLSTEMAKCDLVCANCHRLRHHRSEW